MLTPAASERVKGAIEAARSAARKIAKAGEQASCEVDLQAMNIVSTARTAFLDVDETAHDEIAMPVEDARAVDFTPEEDAAFALADEIEARAYEESEASTEIATPSAPVPQFEIEE
jgi:hypothetical protein